MIIILALENITKSYRIGKNSQEVLKGINIKFRRNEFTSILGPSGCGKTTLLNIIGGLDKYDSGELIIDGIKTKKYTERDWDSYRNYRIGFIFQSYNLIMHQSVLQNVEIALTLKGLSKHKRRKKAIEALESVGLKNEIHKKPNELSGGQMQRVAIARAIVNDPEIILADEPTGALDSVTSIQIMDLLKEISKDKLVIMVTHNPKIAKKYSTRIIELKDGLITKDSNPYDEEEKEVNSKKTTKTSMSLLTSLSLSFNNLLTKKGRTFLTAFAGSIGIIGIALILSLSNGVNNYAKELERDSMSDYPITLSKTSYDLFGTIAKAFSDAAKVKECEDGKICSRDDLVSASLITSEGLIKRNNLKEFKKYIDNNKEILNYGTISYTYNMILQVFTKDYKEVNPSTLIAGKDNNIFKEISSNYEKYTLLSGEYPKKDTDLVIVLNSEKDINDSLLYALGIKNREELAKDLEKIRKDENYSVETTTYTYEDLINKSYKLILNTDYYKEDNNKFIDMRNSLEYMKNKINNGRDINIVGIVVDKNADSSYVGYTHELTVNIINEISKTNLYKAQINNEEINVITGEKFDGITSTYEDLVSTLGIYEIESPSEINIYPKDYDSKEKIVEYINKYNEEKKDNNQKDLVISYTDLMKSIVGGITRAVNIISYVLIAFVAISLIVSSIMISIITYISVLERTKEIGILRSIGASKKDIKRVFRAETIIEGLIAGLLGIGIALLISIPINLVVKSMADINNISNLSIINAIALVILSTVLNVIAGLKPAGMAAKKNPVEALRSE